MPPQPATETTARAPNRGACAVAHARLGLSATTSGNGGDFDVAPIFVARSAKRSRVTIRRSAREDPLPPYSGPLRLLCRVLGLPTISTAPLTRPEAAEMEARAKTIRNNHTGEN